MTVLGDASLASMLHPLTEGLAVRLGLAATMPPWAAQPPQRREPGVALAGDRLVCLLLDDDPTRDGGARPPKRTTACRRLHVRTRGLRSSLLRSVRLRSSPPYLLRWRHTRRAAQRSRTSICSPGSSGAAERRQSTRCISRRRPDGFGGYCATLRGPSVSRREFVRWQVMLSGKDADAQLWAVRPPIGGFDHLKVREWAARTLALAGYDPVLMLTEWEIYWRRKVE